MYNLATVVTMTASVVSFHLLSPGTAEARFFRGRASYSTCAQVYPCVETYPCPPLGYGGQGYVSVPAVGEIDESQRPSPLTLEEKKLLLNLLGNISRSLDTGSPQTDPGVRQDLKALRQKLAPAGAKTETDKK